jgi:hypothetical protein
MSLANSTIRSQVIVVTYSGEIGTYSKIESKFSHSVTLYASKIGVHKLIASGKIKCYIAAGTTVIIVASITCDGVIKGLKEALEPVLCVSGWIHCGVEDLASINLGQGKNLVSKWHTVLKRIPHKFVPPSLEGDSLPPITDFDFLRFKPEPFEILFQRMISIPVLPQTNVSIVIMPLQQGSDRTKKVDGLKYLAHITGSEVFHLDGNDQELDKKLWAKLHNYISDLPLFGKQYIFVCSKHPPLSSYKEMKRSYCHLRNNTPLGKGVFLETLPYDNGALAIPKMQFFDKVALHLGVLSVWNDSSALPPLLSHSGAPKHSNMLEVD